MFHFNFNSANFFKGVILKRKLFSNWLTQIQIYRSFVEIFSILSQLCLWFVYSNVSCLLDLLCVQSDARGLLQGGEGAPSVGGQCSPIHPVPPCPGHERQHGHHRLGEKANINYRGCYMLIWFVIKTKDHLLPFVWIDPVLLKGDWLVSSIFDDILLIWPGLIYVRWLCTCSKHCHSTSGFHVNQTSLSSSNGWCHLTSPSLKTNSPGMSWASSTGELIKR